VRGHDSVGSRASGQLPSTAVIRTGLPCCQCYDHWGDPQLKRKSRARPGQDPLLPPARILLLLPGSVKSLFQAPAAILGSTNPGRLGCETFVSSVRERRPRGDRNRLADGELLVADLRFAARQNERTKISAVTQPDRSQLDHAALVYGAALLPTDRRQAQQAFHLRKVRTGAERIWIRR
jgi:hypothetical protein